MLVRHGTFILWACLLLLATLCPAVQSRRGFGGFGRGGGSRGWGGSSYRAPPVQTGSSGSSAGRIAGAAAAGALGGAVIGHGLSRPSYGGGYGGYGFGGGYGGGYGGYPRGGYGYGGGRQGYVGAGEFRNETDADYYYGGSGGLACQCVVVVGSVATFLLGRWVA